jgi:large subunit ribosomal protein L25
VPEARRERKDMEQRPDRGEVVLEVEARADRGKNACRRIRASGRVPGNVYGLDRPPFMVAVDPRRIEELLRRGSGRNTVFTLRLVGQDSKRDAMIRELQRDPLTDRPVHVDFVRIDATKAVHVRVPIRLLGLATGVKNEGGILDFVHREVEVECLPGLIPEHLDVDVSELHLNQHATFSDLVAPEGVRVLGDPGEIIAVVSTPKAEEEPAVVAAVAEPVAAEPEVVKKGKEAGAEEREEPKG